MANVSRASDWKDNTPRWCAGRSLHCRISGQSMSALGHERQMRSVRGNGACPLRPEKRTNGQTSRYVRFVPSAVIPCRYHRQADDRAKARSAAPSDLCGIDRQFEFRPASVQSLECAFAFEPRELMAETEMDACAKGNVAIGPSLEIELFGQDVCRGIHVSGHQHGHDLIATFEPGTV